MHAAAPFSFNPFDEATRRDPYALFARARREHPAWRHEGLPVVAVFRHADCQAILRDPPAWPSAFPTPPGVAPEDVPRSMLVTGPPEHTRLRALVSMAFTPRRVRQLMPRIEAIATGLLDGALARREVDLVETLAYPLPVVVIAELIGVPAEDRAQFKAWSNALVAPLGTAFFEVAPPERVATLRQVRGELEAYFVRLVEARRREPRDDLLSALVAAELEGSRLSFEELLAMLILLLVAGNETTTHLIGNAVLAFLAHPEALAAVRTDPTRVPTAVEEVLRFSSPVQMDPRLATRETQLHGVAVAAGEVVLCWLGSANRDEAAFQHADVFDIGREQKPDVAFGFGPHYWVGGSVAGVGVEGVLGVVLGRGGRSRRA